MNPSLSDPNNHVPELAPDDDWGDEDQPLPEPKVPPVVLPPRRTASDRGDATAEPVVEIGLRIEPNVAREEPSRRRRQLEVKEIGGSIVRLHQAANTPQKVERLQVFMERSGQENGEGRLQGEGVAWGTLKRHSTGWMLISGVVIAAIVTFALVLLPSINKSNRGRDRGENVVSNLPAEDEIEGVEAMNLLIAQQSEAMQLYRAYATATRWDEVVSLMREDQARDESLRVSWKPLGVSKEWSPAVDCSWTADRLGKDVYGTLGGELPDHTRFLAYFVRADRRLLLDWKATTGFGTATFDQLKKGQGDPREIRGEISPADFYTITWPEADYQSYLLMSPDGVTSIWCYARRDEPANARIAPLFNQGEIVQESKDSLPITLRLQRGPGDAQPNQWSIGEVHYQGWVKP